MIRGAPRADRRWNLRDARSGRYVSRAEVAAQMARLADAYSRVGSGLATWPARHATADVHDHGADARGFFDVATPATRPPRAARLRAAHAASAWGLTEGENR